MRVRVFQAALHHEVKRQLADNFIVRTIVRLSLDDFANVFLRGSHFVPSGEVIITESSEARQYLINAEDDGGANKSESLG